MARFAFSRAFARIHRSCREPLASLSSRLFPVSLCLSFALVVSAFGQNDPGPGIFPFSTQGIGNVDLATGHIQLTVPIRSKVSQFPAGVSVKSGYWSSVVGTSYAYTTSNGIGVFWNISPGSFGLRLADPTTTTMSVTTTTEGDCPGGGIYSKVIAGGIVDSTGESYGVSLTWYVGSCNQTVSAGPVTSTYGGTLALVNSVPTFTDASGNVVEFFCGPKSCGSSTVTDPDGNITTWAAGQGENGTVTDILGTADLCATYGTPEITSLYYNDASGTQRAYTFTYTSLPYQTNFGCSGITEASGGSLTLLTGITMPAGSYSFAYEPTPGHIGYYTGRIAKITYPSGGSISYAYSDSAGHNGMNCTSHVVPTLQVTTNDNNGNSSTLTYVNSNTTAPFQGFVEGNYTVTATDPAGNQKVYSFAGEYQTQTTAYEGGCPTTISGCKGGGTLLRTTTTCYNGNFANCATPSALPSQPLSQTDVYTTFNGSANNLVETKFDTYGNTIEVKQYDFGAAMPPTGSPVSDTLTYYGQGWNGTACTAYPSGIYITDTPCYSYTKNSVGTIVAQTQITYSSTGHPTTTTKSTSLAASLTSTATYNTNGTVSAVKDVNTNQSATYTYAYNGTGSCKSLLPTSVTVTGAGLPSGGLTNSTEWDCNGAVRILATDPNSQVTTTNYLVGGVGDPFYRPLSSVDALGNTTSYSYSPTTFESAMNFNGTTSTSDQLATTDGVGRQIFAQTRQAQGSSTFDTTQTKYGWTTTTSTVAGGLLTTASVPYTGTAAEPAPSGTATTTTQNDALGRPLTITDGGGGTVSFQYINNDVLQTIGPAPSGENVKRRQLEYDGLGRLTSVCEITSASGSGAGACGQSNSQTGLLSKYTYDALGNLLTVTQNAQPGAVGSTQTRTYTYDGLSRLTSETNPETNNVAYTYTYDTDTTCGTFKGDLVKSIDPNGNTICNTYDALHRTTSTTFSGPNATTNRYFVYDAATVDGTAMLYPKGRLVEGYTAPSLSGTKVTDEGFSYTPRGELANFYESTPHSAGYYSVPMTYWANGLVETFGPFLTYASLGYNPDGEGRPYSLQFVDWLASTSYNAAGQPTQLMTPCANGTCYPISYQYDPNTLRMTQYSWALSGGTVSGTLNWNPNGSLQKLVVADPFNSADAQTCTYSADDLVRISSVSCNSGAVWGQQFTYDAFGNLTKTVPTGATGITWQPGYSSSTNRYTLGGTSYDANGSVLKDTFNIYTWDAEGKNLSTAYNNGGGETFSFTYDAFGHKVELAVNGTYSLSYLTLGNYKLSATGQTANYSLYPLPGGSYVSVGGGLTGVQMADWLGTIRAVASDSGADIQTGAHAPFGEEYSFTSAYPKPSIFTGQLDDGNDNPTTYYFQERNYPSSQGRWLSPDPAGLGAVDPTNPQSWNRYVYALNNPLSAIDPLGLWCVWEDGTHDDDPGDGGADSNGCTAQGGHWDPYDTITGIFQQNGIVTQINYAVPGESFLQPAGHDPTRLRRNA